MKKSTLVLCLFLFNLGFLSAQYGGPRLFLDIPSIYFHVPDAEKIGDRMGAGIDAAFNMGTHWSVARIGGGATFTVAPQAEDVGKSVQNLPFVNLEVGVGKYRTNGNQCAKTKHNAFTAMAKAGVRHTFYTGDLRTADNTGVTDLAVGAEFGYFFIRDIFKNYEVVLNGVYLTKQKVVQANFGFKLFLNLRADR
jgi:hypothetical protein